MKTIIRKPSISLLLLLAPVPLLAGCSQDFASVDDVYVPAMVEDRFPINVVERPVKLNVAAGSGALSAEDTRHLVSFARVAGQAGSSPVRVGYPASSAKARGVSQQAVRVLMAQGVPRSMIHVASYQGKSDLVSLSFTSKVAAMKPCGDWSKNIAANPENESPPDFGCSYQNNFAAMVANPDDFERPRTMGPATAASQMSAMDSYNSGRWSRPPIDPANISTIGD
jgi:pilus assembly protein CpaD